MDWVFSQIKLTNFPPPPPPPPPSFVLSNGFNLDNKVSPSILLIIIILSIIFFISGLIHLLVRFLLRPTHREPEDLNNVTAFQGQLQQLFHLHDSGVDQSFIDTLPVFNYKAIIGSKNPFDCAVCLCEFEADDELRLLPKCSHAFHVECIDTWLLSHSTCPLCRANLLTDFSPNKNSCSPFVLVLESGSESSREIVLDRENQSGIGRTNPHLGFHGFNEIGSSRIDTTQKSSETAKEEDANAVTTTVMVDSGEKVMPVKLGKFKNVDGAGEGSSNSNGGNSKKVDERRCFSMGSFEYVMDESSSLKVAVRTPVKKQGNKKHALPLAPGYRAAMSECDCESRREFKFNGLEEISAAKAQRNENSIKRESFSVSKIWLRGKKEKEKANGVVSGRRAFSFRFSGEGNGNGNGGSDIEIGRWENGGSEIDLGIEEENQRQSGNSLDSEGNPTSSFVRKTLLWFMGGRQNKVVHSSFAPNV